MATFMDLFNQTGQQLGTAMDNPWTQLGLQLMQAGGPQQTQMSGGQRLAGALGGFADMRQATMARQQAQAELARQKQVNQAVQGAVGADPGMLANNPLARAVLQSGGTLDDLKGLDKFATGTGTSGMAKMPWQRDVRNPDGSVTQHFFNQQSGQYEPGATYMPAPEQNVGIARTNAETRQGMLDVAQTNAATGQTRAATGQGQLTVAQDREARQAAEGQAQMDRAREESLRKQQTQDRELAANWMKSKFERGAFQSTYRRATTQLDDVIAQAERVRDHKGLAGNYGRTGWIMNAPGGDAADAWADVQKLTANLGLAELGKLRDAGVVLTPVSNTDLDIVTRSAMNPDKFQSVKQAKEVYGRVVEVLKRVKAESAESYNYLNGLYDEKAAQPRPVPGQVAPLPGQGGAPAAGYDADAAEAAKLIQQRPELRDEINRRLTSKYGRGL